MEFSNFNRNGEDDNAELVAEFLEELVRRVVWDYESSESPGPLDVNFGFIMKFWEFFGYKAKRKKK